MELRQLQYLVSVSDEGSFTKAAAKAHVAQPGVSAQIRQLERELGQTLLDRSGGTVRPTEVGAAVITFARAILSAVAGIRQTVDALTGLVRGHVTLGMVASISTPRIDLPQLLAAFHREYPGIDITLNEARSDQLIGALQAGQLDIAFVGLGAGAPPDGLATIVIATEPLVVAVDRGHPLAASQAIAFESLRDQVLISLPRGTGLRSQIDEACASAGFQPRVAFEAGDPQLLADLAGQGLGMAILPASAAAAHGDGLSVLALTRPRLYGRIALAWLADQPASPATEAFLKYARRTYPDAS
jgi:DNA-binding transcriptional LysR family regulator